MLTKAAWVIFYCVCWCVVEITPLLHTHVYMPFVSLYGQEVCGLYPDPCSECVEVSVGKTLNSVLLPGIHKQVYSYLPVPSRDKMGRHPVSKVYAKSCVGPYKEKPKGKNNTDNTDKLSYLSTCFWLITGGAKVITLHFGVEQKVEKQSNNLLQLNTPLLHFSLRLIISSP